MAAGDLTIVGAQTRTQYTTPSANLIGKAFSRMLDVAQGNTNILSQLEGPEGGDHPFVQKQDLSKGGMDTVYFNVAAALGSAGRRGGQRAVNYEEGLHHNTWSVTIDVLRCVVAWSELVRWAASSGATWQEYLPTAVGELSGRILQEDRLCRLRQRSTTMNTVRPGLASSYQTLTYSDTLDTATLSKGYELLKLNGAKPANLGKMTGGMDLKKFVCLGSSLQMEGLWQDPTFTNALNHAAIDGPLNPFWTNDLPDWRGMVMKRWDIENFDTAGTIASSVMPQAILGDGSAASGANIIATGTTAFTIYGGGISQANLGNEATLFKPFELFYGCDKLLGETISTGSDATVYYFVVIDPADGKWNLYSYNGSSGINGNGFSLTVLARLHSSTTGVAYTTIQTDGFGGSGTTLWTYDPNYNKVAFPIGSIIIQVTPYIAPVCDAYAFGKEVGAVCYGTDRNKPIQNVDDYGALNGKGILTISGCDVAGDSQALKHRRFVRYQTAYEHPYGALLPKIARAN